MYLHTHFSIVHIFLITTDFPLSAQPDSRLVMILKVLKSRTKPRNIFDAEFAVTNARVPDPVDAEVELVDHMAGAGRVDAQLDGEEDVDIWAEPDDSRKNILRIKDDNGKSVIKAANLNKLVQVFSKFQFHFQFEL